MWRPLAAVVVGVLLAVVSIAPAAGASSYCSYAQSIYSGTHSFLGVSAPDLITSGPHQQDCTLGRIAASHIGFVRAEMDWSGVELRPRHWDFAGYDRMMAAFARHRVSWMPILMHAPAFRSQALNASAPGLGAPQHPAQFAWFAHLAVARYGPGGTFWQSHPALPYDPVRAWQIWNEVNLPYYWQPRLSPSSYTNVLKAAFVSIRRVDPHATILPAGLVFSGRGIPAPNFFSGMYRHGARRYFSALALHAYAPMPSGALARVMRVRHLMNRFGDRHKPLWITEFGWANAGPPTAYQAGRDQGRRVLGFLAAIRRWGRRLGVTRVLYYDWRDVVPPRGEVDWWGLHTGLYNRRGVAKPVAHVFLAAAARLNH